jgi:hypothetical protein
LEKAMGFKKLFKPIFFCRFFLMAVGMLCATGCQVGPTTSRQTFLAHQALVDFTGLDSGRKVDSLKISIAPPRDWEQIQTRQSILSHHQQWRSPSRANAVGVAYLNMPIPLSARMIVWFAKHQYASQSVDGKIVGEWTDSLNRSWFEAENGIYHVRGYVITRGRDAWLVYCGYKIKAPPQPEEISLAARSLETIVPVVD